MSLSVGRTRSAWRAARYTLLVPAADPTGWAQVAPLAEPDLEAASGFVPASFVQPIGPDGVMIVDFAGETNGEVEAARRAVRSPAPDPAAARLDAARVSRSGAFAHQSHPVRCPLLGTLGAHVSMQSVGK